MRIYITLDKVSEAEIVISENGRVLSVACTEIATCKRIDLTKSAAFEAVKKAKRAYDEKQLTHTFAVPRDLHFIVGRGGSETWSSYESLDSVPFSPFANPSLILN